MSPLRRMPLRALSIARQEVLLIVLISLLMPCVQSGAGLLLQDKSGEKKARSEGIPPWLGRIFEIAHIGAEAQAHAGADGGEHDVVALLEIHAQTADEIG